LDDRTVKHIYEYQYEDDSKNPVMIGQDFNLSAKFLKYKKKSLKLLVDGRFNMTEHLDNLFAVSSIIFIRTPPLNTVQFLDQFMSRKLYDILIQKYGERRLCPEQVNLPAGLLKIHTSIINFFEDGTLRQQIFLNVNQFILLLEEEALEIDKQNNVGPTKGYAVIDRNRLNLP
jgi:hypothetical protein